MGVRPPMADNPANRVDASSGSFDMADRAARAAWSMLDAPHLSMDRPFLSFLPPFRRACAAPASRSRVSSRRRRPLCERLTKCRRPVARCRRRLFHGQPIPTRRRRDARRLPPGGRAPTSEQADAAGLRALRPRLSANRRIRRPRACFRSIISRSPTNRAASSKT